MSTDATWCYPPHVGLVRGPHVSDANAASRIDELFGILQKNRNSTLYYPLIESSNASSDNAVTVREQSTALMLDDLLWCLGGSPNDVRERVGEEISHMCDAVETVRRVRGGDRTALLSPDAVCPMGSIWMKSAGLLHGIYDLDGIDYLVWTSLCRRDRQAIRDFETNLCPREIPRSFVCTPMRAVSISAMQNCFVPDALAVIARREIDTLEQDAVREMAYANTYRSTRYGGPPMATVVMDLVSSGPDLQTIFGGSGGGAAAAAATAPKKQLRKWGDSRQRAVAATRTVTQDDGEEGTDAPIVAAAGAATSETAETDAVAASIKLAQRALADGDVGALDFDNEDAFLGNAGIGGRGLMAGASASLGGKKKSGATGPTHASGDYGDVDFGSAAYSLMQSDTASLKTAASTSTAPPKSRYERKASWSPEALAEVTLAEYVRSVWHLALDDVALSAQLVTPWSDQMTSDANNACSPYEEAFPCACTAELVTRIAEHVHKRLVCQTMRSVNGLHGPKITLPDDALDVAAIREAVTALAMDLAFGTVHALTARDPSFARMLNWDCNLFYNELPSAIAGGISASTRPAPYPKVSCNIRNLPFALETGMSTAAGSDSPTCPNPLDLRSWVIRRWSGQVQTARDAVIAGTATAVPQLWHFVPVQKQITPAAAVDDLLSLGLRGQAVELAAAAAKAGSLNTTKRPSVLVLTPPQSWPCDVCLAPALAAAALETRLLGTGIAVVADHSRTMVVLPERSFHAEGLIIGAMIAAMAGGRERPAHISGCDFVYPFAFVCLAVAESITRKEIEAADEAAKRAEGDENAPEYHPWVRTSCYLHLARAALAHLSNSFAALLDAEADASLGFATHIPAYSADLGTVSRDDVMNRPGLVDIAVNVHREWAVAGIYQMLPALMATARKVNVGSAAPSMRELARGVVCAARPLRLWKMDARALKPVIGKLGALLSPAGPSTKPILESLARLALQPAGDASGLVALGADLDLVHRTWLNALVLRVIAESGEAEVAISLRAIGLAPYSSDAVQPRSARHPIADEACGTGEHKPWQATTEQTGPIPGYDETRDGFPIPSLLAVAKEFLMTARDCDAVDKVFQHYQTAEASSKVRHGETLCSLGDKPATLRGLALKMADGCYPALAWRSCSQTFLGASGDFVLMPDNPMTLAGSRVHVCDSCRTASPAVRTIDALPGGDHLLPKNSPLLATLMHWRRGVTFMPVAWPSGTKDGKLDQEYSSLTVRAISNNARDAEVIVGLSMNGVPAMTTALPAQPTSAPKARAAIVEDDEFAAFEAMMSAGGSKLTLPKF